MSFERSEKQGSAKRGSYIASIFGFAEYFFAFGEQIAYIRECFKRMAIIPGGLPNKSISGIVTSEQKRQKKMLIIFIIVILITAVFLYFNFFSSPTTQTSISPPIVNETNNLDLLASKQDEVMSLEEVSLDFSVFDNPKFKALKDFGSEVDISLIEKGRRNPFLSY